MAEFVSHLALNPHQEVTHGSSQKQQQQREGALTISTIHAAKVRQAGLLGRCCIFLPKQSQQVPAAAQVQQHHFQDVLERKILSACWDCRGASPPLSQSALHQGHVFAGFGVQSPECCKHLFLCRPLCISLVQLNHASTHSLTHSLILPVCAGP
jgi:hypothetical protein